MVNHFFKKKKKYILLTDITKLCNFDAKFFLKNQKIYNVGNLREAKSNEITFFDNLNYEKDAISCKAFACITNERFAKFLNKEVMPIISKKPLLDFYKVVKIFYPDSSVDNENIVSFKISKKFSKKNISIGSNCLIDQTVQIGSNTKIGNNVLIKPKVSINEDWVTIEIDSSNILSQNNDYKRVVSLCEKGNYTEAKPILQNLIKKNPSNSEYHRIMGQILSDEGDQEEAINCLIDALRWDSKNGWALLMMGNIFSKFKNDIPTTLKY